jgi:heat shock protein 4
MEKSGAIGIDIGGKHTVVATVKAGGIEIVLNESSGRGTPTMISFGEHERLIGEPALAQQRSNHKNTIPYLQRLLGLNSDCQDQLAIEKSYMSATINEREDKKLGISVLNKGERIELVPEQLLGAFLNKIKGFWTSHEEKPDVVIGVPPYFSAVERQALLDAAKIANMNCLRLLNENTAVALSYGFFRRKELTEKERNVVFLDVGHCYSSVTVASFT